jgi:hypothetical protein
MFERYVAAHNVRRFKRLLAGQVDRDQRRVLERRLWVEKLKLLGPNAHAVDPARLFHGR